VSYTGLSIQIGCQLIALSGTPPLFFWSRPCSLDGPVNGPFFNNRSRTVFARFSVEGHVPLTAILPGVLGFVGHSDARSISLHGVCKCPDLHFAGRSNGLFLFPFAAGEACVLVKFKRQVPLHNSEVPQFDDQG